MFRQNSWSIPSIYLISGCLYSLLLYATPRQEFLQVWGILAALWLGYIAVLLQMKESPFPLLPLRWQESSRRDTFWFKPYSLIIIGLGFRLIALFALPQLSDDYFRFVWDGRLLAQGINPFLQLPSTYMENPTEALALGLTEELYQGLNSKDYFTIYPPILQGIFSLGATLFPDNLQAHLWLMKGCVFLAEAGSLWLIFRLLQKMKLPPAWLAIYALNPLAIVELTGNLHFEALMIMGLLWCIWELKQKRWKLATIPFAIAVGSKLLPLMLLPLLIRRLGWLRAIGFGALVLFWTGLMFLPILDVETFLHLQESVGLYFQSFEFNASIYYLVRWLGYQVTGYNIIQTAGPLLAGVTVLGIFVLTFLEKPVNLSRSMMWVFLFYLSLSSIVHPWYSITLIALCSLTRYRFPLIWSLLIPLSYATYRTSAYEESMWLVAVEYVLLLLAVIYELRMKEKLVTQ